MLMDNRLYYHIHVVSSNDIKQVAYNKRDIADNN